MTGTRMLKRAAWRAGIGTIAIMCAATLRAQQAETFKARLSAVPITAATASTTLGSGSVTGTLHGNVLTIKGIFDGLNSPATAARVHLARPGMRGLGVYDLTIAKASSGAIEGSITLTADDVDHLKRGWMYVQIQTEKNPEGHLRGWLMK
jgi:hypothetical protein